MKRVLVIGASGGMGYAIVKELVSRETFQIVAFARTQSKLEKLFGNDSNVIVHPGDVFNVEALKAAGQGAEIIFHALSVPYHEWKARQPVLMNNILSVAKEVNAKLVVVDNFYTRPLKGLYKTRKRCLLATLKGIGRTVPSESYLRTELERAWSGTDYG
jgi:shikimate 5-dehydrogenase